METPESETFSICISRYKNKNQMMLSISAEIRAVDADHFYKRYLMQTE